MKTKLAGKLRKLARQIAVHEGKKSQVKFGDILEVLRVISRIEAKGILIAKKESALPSTIMRLHAGYAVTQILMEKNAKLRKKRKVTVLKKVRRKK